MPSRSAGAARERHRCPSFNEGPAPVVLNVYWQRSVDFDEQGRVVRRLGGDDLSWGKKFFKDVLGVYHVGVEVHGDEYTFGNYHASNSRQIGSASSGVYRHDPCRPGPHCVFKQAVAMGNTSKARRQVEDLCEELGDSAWSKASYNRIHHNCVDFSRTLARTLGCEDIPSWCYRGAATAKLLGIGGEPPVEARAAQAQDDSALGLAGDTAALDTTVPQEPNVQPPRVLSLDSKRTGSSVTLAVGMGARPPSACAGGHNSTTPDGEQLVGRCVSVFQAAGHWARGQVVAQEADGRYIVQYDNPPMTESGVFAFRLVPLPEVPRDTTLLAQACRLDDQGSRIDATRRSPTCWPQHGLTAGTLPVAAATAAAAIAATAPAGGLPAQPQATCYPVFHMGSTAPFSAISTAPRRAPMPTVLPMAVPQMVQATPVRWNGLHAVVRGS